MINVNKEVNANCIYGIIFSSELSNCLIPVLNLRSNCWTE